MQALQPAYLELLDAISAVNTLQLNCAASTSLALLVKQLNSRVHCAVQHVSSTC
jgi:hypothetical protein